MAPLRTRRLRTGHQPGYEGVSLPQHENGGLLRRRLKIGRQVRWHQTSSRPSVGQQGSQRPGEAGIFSKAPAAWVFLDILDAPSIHLEGDKVPALVGIIATSNTDAGGAPSPQGCVLAVTTHNRGCSKPLASTLPDPPASLVKHRRQESATPSGEAGGPSTEVPDAALEWAADAPEHRGMPPSSSKSVR